MPPGSVFVISTATVRRVVFLLLTIAVVGAAVYYGRGFIGRPPLAADQVDHRAYQVVWLTTGQAFYGRLAISDAESV